MEVVKIIAMLRKNRLFDSTHYCGHEVPSFLKDPVSIKTLVIKIKLENRLEFHIDDLDN